MQSNEKSGLKLITLRKWEATTREVWRIRLKEWYEIPVDERAIMVIAHHLPSWEESIHYKEDKAKRGAGNVQTGTQAEA